MKPESIGAFDAKTHLSQLLDRVEHGDRFEITRRGRPVARLVPCEPDVDREGLKLWATRVREERGLYGVTREEMDAWKREGRA